MYVSCVSGCLCLCAFAGAAPCCVSREVRERPSGPARYLGAKSAMAASIIITFLCVIVCSGVFY